MLDSVTLFVTRPHLVIHKELHLGRKQNEHGQETCSGAMCPTCVIYGSRGPYISSFGSLLCILSPLVQHVQLTWVEVITRRPSRAP